jgi:GTP cyclohydrolase II
MNQLYSRAMNVRNTNPNRDGSELIPSEARNIRQSTRAVDRAISDIRRGLPVVVTDENSDFIVALAAEQVTDQLLTMLVEFGGAPPKLVITAERAAVLHIPPTGKDVAALNIEAGFDPAGIRDLADPTVDLDHPLRGPFPVSEILPSAPNSAAVELCKLAKLLPATVTTTFSVSNNALAEEFATTNDLLLVTAESVQTFQKNASETLIQVTSARVPLAGAETAEVIAFRPHDGGVEHLAIVIGEPVRRSAVLTRLHSECFTGDLLESLRCDCGTQLRATIDMLNKEGSGVLLYLAQEGRGIGLINKLRAYRLQDQGFDTFDANERLGFEPDERIFEPAAQILRLLGISRVRLLTNNPQKVSNLQSCGIEVVERVPHAFPANPHNAHYLQAKAKRAGHTL